jgi:hypothetical protein
MNLKAYGMPEPPVESVHNMFKLFKMEEFTAAAARKDNMLGSHSIRKSAPTRAHHSRCTKDNKDIQGQWKSKAQVSEVYKDT